MEIGEIASLKPGGIYLLRPKQCLSQEQLEIVRGEMKRINEECGVRFVVIDGGLSYWSTYDLDSELDAG